MCTGAEDLNCWCCVCLCVRDEGSEFLIRSETNTRNRV